MQAYRLPPVCDCLRINSESFESTHNVKLFEAHLIHIMGVDAGLISVRYLVHFCDAPGINVHFHHKRQTTEKLL